MSENQIYIPNLKWYQDKENIYLDINALNAENFKLNIIETVLSFSYLSNNLNYEMKFPLYDDIENIKYLDYKSSIKITIQKKTNNYWNYITKDKNLYKNYIKLDWNKWIDIDTDEEKDFDLSNMMGNMAGMMNNENSPFDFSKMMQSMNNNIGEEEMDGSDDLDEINDNESEEYCETCVNNEEV